MCKMHKRGKVKLLKKNKQGSGVKLQTKAMNKIFEIMINTVRVKTKYLRDLSP